MTKSELLLKKAEEEAKKGKSVVIFLPDNVKIQIKTIKR